MERAKVDAAFFSVREEDSWRGNVFYYTGFAGSSAQLLVTKDAIHFLSDSRYELQISKEVNVTNPSFYVYKGWKQMLGILRDITKREAIKSIGVDENDLPLKYALALRRLKTKPVEMSAPLAKIRSAKEAGEIRSIKKAAGINARALEKVLALFRAGVSEKDIAADLEYQMKKFGAAERSFDTIIASGPRGALPHGRASEKRLKSGELAVVDFGCLYNNYCSDETVMVGIGRLSAEQKEAHEIVSEARQRAFDVIRPGARLAEIDAAAREFVKSSKFGKFAFGHGLGHGIGLRVHEWPSLSPASEAVAEEGMIFSIEPGIYVPGKFGVRLEDLVLVTKNGFRKLTKLPKEEILHG